MRSSHSLAHVYSKHLKGGGAHHGSARTAAVRSGDGASAEAHGNSNRSNDLQRAAGSTNLDAFAS